MSNRAKTFIVAGLFFVLGLVVNHLSTAVVAQPASKGPKWSHAMSLAARKSTEADFTKDTRKFGIEVFKDENNGNWIYISETGDIAVVPAK
ncbi:MAG: hypothetical protein AB7K24_10765 [Gemmataceae bacterium]